ncbi:hypothetical protein VE03_01304 [Pseudogymnoascus sp. 23342-1-I1]|nr:hypothetical protein VE03_01304 [Pseudogymnoascus sp. 23342-1-I1]
MDWPWHINTDLSSEQKALRRQTLDRYGLYAHLSSFLPIALYWLYVLTIWVFGARQTRGEYAAVPGSPHVKRGAGTAAGRAARWWRGWVFRVGGRGWAGQEQERVVHKMVGLAWAVWLGVLSVHGTGDDYLHLTKRFGTVAASQLPILYLLMMKNRYSPLRYLLRSSHEELNPYHRILGRIIVALFSLHAGFYLNFFIRANLVKKLFTRPVPSLGLVAIILMLTLYITSINTIRTYSYRIFYVTHFSISLLLAPVLFFHASPVRLYLIETLALVLFNTLTRRLTSFLAPSTITTLPSTTLLKLTIPIPPSHRTLYANAQAQHVYLSIPPPSQPTSGGAILNLCSNPYTIASVAADTTSLTLIARSLAGPTSARLLELTELWKARPPLRIEGPYGGSTRFPDFASEFDRVLLVAGGVGGTFVLPLYQRVRADMERRGGNTERVVMVWSVRSAAEVEWAAEAVGEVASGVEIVVTREEEEEVVVDGGVEMLDLAEEGGRRKRGRVDVGGVVDGVFRKGEGEKVAVLVCGPGGMAREVRAAVGRWVNKGRDVWFHEEGFGF